MPIYDLAPAPDTSLAALKAAKNLKINEWRAAANGTTFPFNGKHIACDEVSFKDIASVAGYIGLFGTFNPGFPGAWKYTDNTYVAMPTVEAFKAMYHAMTQQGSLNFQYAQGLKFLLEMATTPETIEAITW